MEKRKNFQSGDSWFKKRALTFSPENHRLFPLNQKPHKSNQNKSMQGVEMNPNLYCVSPVGDSWAWETYSNTCSLAQLLLTETPLLHHSPIPPPSLSPSRTHTPCSSDIPISAPPL